MKEESEKAGLKVNIQQTKIPAPGPITSWQIDGETVETVTDYFLSVIELQYFHPFTSNLFASLCSQ